ncbi:hypothetical protein EOL96_03590 [Candidatus Saccharibacteria bacterium]|nr:hypothetical protein [Candidatus Saccharibacteria bacterium]
MPVYRDHTGTWTHARLIVEDLQPPPPQGIDYSKLKQEFDSLAQKVLAAELGKRSVRHATGTHDEQQR